MKLQNLLFAFALTFSAFRAETADTNPETTCDGERTRWFQDARLGIFIHWGVYSVPAGEYQGKPVWGIGEWIMKRGEIPVKEYRSYAREFSASNFNPEEWADLIKESGARYMVITAKHHDGFSLYDSAMSDWDVAGDCPAPDDLLAPLADAVRKRGIKFGLYYSQAQDWNHPGGAIAGKGPGEPGWDPAQKGDFDSYLREVALPQTREILTRYQPDVLWWDTPQNMNAERAAPLHALLELQPKIITNNRLGGGFQGDTKTPEQHVPPRGFPGEMFEVCMTMNDTWGFKKDDHNWKSSREIIRKLSDISSKGGNFLLNIGPDSTGRIPEPSQKILKDLGRWMRTNSEAIYATQASPFPRRLPWGRVTRKTADDDSTILYLHVWDWPTDGRLLLPTLETKPSSAHVLATGEKVDSSTTPDGLILTLPGAAPDADASILKLSFDSTPVITQRPFVEPGNDGTITLTAHEADCHGNLEGNIPIKGVGNAASLAGWKDPGWRVEYQLKTPAEQIWKVEAEVRAEHPAKLLLKCGTTEVEAEIPVTPGDSFQSSNLGNISLPAGEATLELRPVKEKWTSIDLRNIRLTPVN